MNVDDEQEIEFEQTLFSTEEKSASEKTEETG
jgi:hypothetical protein